MLGRGKGRGYNVNIPWEKKGYGDAEVILLLFVYFLFCMFLFIFLFFSYFFQYIAATEEVVAPILKEFDPDLLIISAGFDARFVFFHFGNDDWYFFFNLCNLFFLLSLFQ